MINFLQDVKFVLIPQKELDEMKSDLRELKVMLQEKTEEERNSVWIESVKIPKLLGISRKTWQGYRDRKLISFAQIGSKIYVKRADLEAFMKSHYIDVNDSYRTETRRQG